VNSDLAFATAPLDAVPKSAFSVQSHDANPPGGFCRAGDILKRQHRDLLVSRQKLRQAERVTLVREKRESGNQILGFATRPFVLCSLPVRRPHQSDLRTRPRITV
jgi:hypothetical protein